MILFKILLVSIGAVLPGSPAARKRECTCPIEENRSGAGLEVSADRDRRGFWIHVDCRIHRELAQS